MKKDKPKILIIEDDVWQIDIYKEYLEDEFCVYDVDNSPDALGVLDEYDIKCIIADYMILGGSCISLFHEIQSYDDLSKIPIILCSNVSDNLNPNDFFEYGVKKVIDKTRLTPRDILNYVKEVL